MNRNHTPQQANGGTPSATHHGQYHPRSFEPGLFVFLVILGIVGSIIGIQLLTTLGVTPNTSIIGALVAMILARVPMQLFQRFRSIHVQNLAQSAISTATFGAANGLLLPIAVPYLMGRPDLVLPMFIGVSLAMVLDGYLLYRMFDSKVFPAAAPWPPGVAVAEAIKAKGPFKTAIGELGFDEKGDITRPDYVLYTWKKGDDGKYTYFQNE